MSKLQVISKVGTGGFLSIKEYFALSSRLSKEATKVELEVDSKVEGKVAKTDVVGTATRLEQFVSNPVVVEILETLQKSQEQVEKQVEKAEEIKLAELAVSIANAINDSPSFPICLPRLPANFHGSIQDFIDKYAPEHCQSSFRNHSLRF